MPTNQPKTKFRNFINWSVLISGAALLFAIVTFGVGLLLEKYKNDAIVRVSGDNSSLLAREADERSQNNLISIEQAKALIDQARFVAESEHLKIKNEYMSSFVEIKEYIDDKTGANRIKFENELKDAMKIHNEVDNQRFQLLMKNQEQQNQAIVEAVNELKVQVKELQNNYMLRN